MFPFRERQHCKKCQVKRKEAGRRKPSFFYPERHDTLSWRAFLGNREAEDKKGVKLQCGKQLTEDSK